MTEDKSRMNITLFSQEKTKLEKLSEEWGVSQARVIGILIRQAKLTTDKEAKKP